MQEDEGYKVGTNLTMTSSWKNGFTAETPNKDFILHIGGWLQFDNVFWSQSPDLRFASDGRPGAKQGVASGANLGGIGNLEDGVYFRRIRLGGVHVGGGKAGHCVGLLRSAAADGKVGDFLAVQRF